MGWRKRAYFHSFSFFIPYQVFLHLILSGIQTPDFHFLLPLDVRHVFLWGEKEKGKGGFYGDWSGSKGETMGEDEGESSRVKAE